MTTTLAPVLADPAANVRALLARADLAAVVDQVLLLTAEQRRDLSEAWTATNRAHAISQIRLCHRVSTAAPGSHPDHAAARAWVWTVANEPRDGYAGAAAASPPGSVDPRGGQEAVARRPRARADHRRR